MADNRYFRLEDGRILSILERDTFENGTALTVASFAVTSASGEVLVGPTVLDQVAADPFGPVAHFDVNDDGGFTFYRYGFPLYEVESRYSEETFDAAGNVTAPLSRSDVFRLPTGDLTNTTNIDGWIDQPGGTFYASYYSVGWTRAVQQGDYADYALYSDRTSNTDWGFDGDTFRIPTKALSLRVSWNPTPQASTRPC